jgi:hypothetical protein
MPAYKYILGEQAKTSDQDGITINEFSNYDVETELRDGGQHIPHDIKIKHVAASKPTPRGNILLIEDAFAHIRGSDNKMGESYHSIVLNRWLDFLEYVHFNQDKLIVKVFDFQCMFPKDKSVAGHEKKSEFGAKLTKVGFGDEDVYLLLYERDDHGGKPKLIGGGHSSVMLFPIPEYFFEENNFKEVGKNALGSRANVFGRDDNRLKSFDKRGTTFVEWLQRFVGNVEEVHWWDNLINRIEKKDSDPVMPAFESLSVLDVIYHYFYVLGKRDEGSKSQFIERSVDYLRKFGSVSSLYEDTQIFRDRIIMESELSGGLMRIPVPESVPECAIKFNTDDIDVLKSVNSEEYFLYPSGNSLDTDGYKLIKISDVKEGRKYFLLRNHQFITYQGEKIVNLSPFFFSYFPKKPYNKMWVMLSNSPENAQSPLGSLRLETTSGYSTRLKDVSEIDYKLYYFNSTLPSEFKFSLERVSQPDIRGLLRLKKSEQKTTSGKATVAIDLGTSNTYIAYQVDGRHDSPQEIEYDQDLCVGLPYKLALNEETGKSLYSFFEKDPRIGEYDRINFAELYRSFFPIHLKNGTTHKFPTFTALRKIDSSPDIDIEAKYRFGFNFVNELKRDSIAGENPYETDVKWSENGKLYLPSLEVIMAFTEAYIYQKYGIAAGNISWIVTQPQAILRSGNYLPRPRSGGTPTIVDEAIAPLNFVNSGSYQIPAQTLVVNTDIGGGTVDIGVAHRSTRSDIYFYKTSCYYGFNRLIEKSPVYNDRVRTIWEVSEKDNLSRDSLYLDDQAVVLSVKKHLSSKGLPENFTPGQSKNLLLYYCSIVWHVSSFLKVLIKNNDDQIRDYSRGIYLQFTGQGSNFIRLLMNRIGIGEPVPNTPFHEYSDDADLSSFHRLFLGENEISIKLRLSKVNADSKKITAKGALLKNESITVAPTILMDSQTLGELGKPNCYLKDEIGDLMISEFSKFVELISTPEFERTARNLFGFSFDTDDLRRITELGDESIRVVERSLKYGGGDTSIASTVGADPRNTGCSLFSSPLLWAFQGIFQRF